MAETDASRPAAAGREADRHRGRGGRALVVAAHGSHHHPGAVEPAFAHADAIRERGGFDEVRAAFWKNEPSLREAVASLASDEVVVVPLFTSEGYFVREVVPREVGVATDAGVDAGRSVRLADPVGTHERVGEVVVERAESVTGDPAVGPGFGLAVVGHGTERSATSARATEEHADRIRATGRFDEVRAAFMDEPPYLEGLLDRFESRDVVVVPLFVADGYHTTEDVPADLGLTDDPGRGWDVPASVDGRRVWYAGAVGTEPGLAEVVLERAAEAGVAPRPDGDGSGGGQSTPATRDLDGAGLAFVEWVAAGDPGRTWGELAVATAGADAGRRRFSLRHRDDRGRPLSALDVHGDPAAVRDLARFDDAGRFRPLSGAPTLPTGWAAVGLDARELVRAVEWLYPAGVSARHREREGDLDATHFREAAARQTGIYAAVADADRETLACTVEACCAGCARRRAWEETADEPVDAPRGDGAFPCREPCSLFVAAVRAFDGLAPDVECEPDAEGEPGSAADGPEPSVRVGELDDPANPYRQGFLAARAARRGGGDR